MTPAGEKFCEILRQISSEADRDKSKGYDPTSGARPIRLAVEKYLEDLLAEEFLRGNIKQGDTLKVHAAGEQWALKGL